MIKELNELAKSTRKVNRDERKGTSYVPGSKINMEDTIFESEKAYSKRKSLICMNENPEILIKFENIITSISNIVDIMSIF